MSVIMLHTVEENIFACQKVRELGILGRLGPVACGNIRKIAAIATSLYFTRTVIESTIFRYVPLITQERYHAGIYTI